MADILIRGMEMPKNGYDCPMNSFGICHVAIDGENCECYDVRADWCPIVPIPEGHGRLIDADELRKAMYHEAFETDSPMQKWESGCWIRYKMFERNLENAPTIVPAEEGNADG